MGQGEYAQEYLMSRLWHISRQKKYKRKNWFVGVHFFDETELPAINESEISYETCRSGGKGGRMSIRSKLLCMQSMFRQELP